MSVVGGHLYDFGDFRLDTSKRVIQRQDGTPVSVPPKAYDTLAYLVGHAGALIQKDALMTAVWPDTTVQENNLTQSISALRRALGDGQGQHRYIATVPGRGYQFVAPVSTVHHAVLSETRAEISLAVLPFANMSGTPEHEYFADGLTDELINALSNVGSLRVVARRSAFTFKGAQKDIREVAQQLCVDLVLEGSLRRCGDCLRITAQLINAADGCHLWSTRYERETGMRDLFKVQDEITLAIVDALKLKLSDGEIAGMLRHHTRSVEAHDLYLKGRFHLFRMTPASIQLGKSWIQKALEADPDDAHAHVGLAHAYRMFALSLEMPPGEILPKAKAAAAKAIELQPDLADAHAVLGFNIFWHEWDWNAAELHLRRALQLDPRSADTLWMYAHLCSNLGRHREALENIARACELDPLSGLMNSMDGQFRLHAGKTDEALLRLREALEIDPASRVAHAFAASAYIEEGLYEKAIAEARAAGAVSAVSTNALAFESYAYAKAGREQEARAALEEALILSTQRYVPPYHIALMYNGLGATAEALTWLEQGFEGRDPKMVFLKVEPKWSNLQDHPGYVRLLKRMRL